MIFPGDPLWQDRQAHHQLITGGVISPAKQRFHLDQNGRFNLLFIGNRVRECLLYAALSLGDY